MLCTTSDVKPLLETYEVSMAHVCSAAKFNGVHTLDIHFPDCLGGGDCTEIYFLGIKGEFYEVSYSISAIKGITYVPGV